jgi:uncharacterized membrane protein YGL010W
VQAPISVALLWLADRVSLLPWLASVSVFAATFVGGWIIQLFGHVLEGRRPALADNFLQIFNAPLFLTAEVLTLIGLRADLHAAHGSVQPATTGVLPAAWVAEPEPVAFAEKAVPGPGRN